MWSNCVKHFGSWNTKSNSLYGSLRRVFSALDTAMPFCGAWVQGPIPSTHDSSAFLGCLLPSSSGAASGLFATGFFTKTLYTLLFAHKAYAFVCSSSFKQRCFSYDWRNSGVRSLLYPIFLFTQPSLLLYIPHILESNPHLVFATFLNEKKS
jgi:hypothetical protein